MEILSRASSLGSVAQVERLKRQGFVARNLVDVGTGASTLIATGRIPTSSSLAKLS